MVLTKKEAKIIFKQIKKQNKGNKQPDWVEHSFFAAECARMIAKHCKGIDEDKAFSLALLHDVGRNSGAEGLLHAIAGYRLMSGMGAKENARICLTHSFPYKDARAFSGVNNLTDDENAFLSEYISNAEYDDYDRLIQLSDGLAMPHGPVMLEKRLVENALRNGINDFTLEKWKAYLELKDYFDEKCGMDIYNIIL